MFPKFHNKYLKVPLLFSGGGGGDWRQHLQPCEWLESGNDCYINLPYNPKHFTYIKGKVEYNKSANDILVFGSNLNTNHLQLYYTNNQWNIRYFCQGNNTKQTNIGNLVCSFDFNDNFLKLNEYTTNVNYSLNKNVSTTLVLFGQITNSSTLDKTNFVKWYNLETNLFNLLSCYVIDEYFDNKGNLCSSDVPGMVDTLTGIFYTNDGSGQFSHGGDINL